MPRHWMVTAVVAVVAVAALYLYAFSPYSSGLYPSCPTRALFDVLCPGCGSQRALHDLLHGRFAAAWGANPAAVLAVPYVATGLLAETAAERHAAWARFRKTCFGRSAALLSVVALATWTLVRNLP